MGLFRRHAPAGVPYRRTGGGSANCTFVPSILVDAVVHAPFGAHPAGMTGRYGPDKLHMANYVAASRDDAAFAEYLRTYVFDVGSHAEYVERFVPRELQRPTRAA